MKQKTYVVFVGRQTGLYNTWDEAEQYVKGYSGARYKSYASVALAAEAFNNWQASEAAANNKVPKYFVVIVGHCCGIYYSEMEAKNQTDNYPNGYYEICNTQEEADAVIERFFIGTPVQKVTQ
jgi:viroplasmin and RNaseH domain-containing protein